MARLLSDKSDSPSSASIGSDRWVVGGTEYANAAAKFWSALLDEREEDYPAADRLRLSAMCGSLLHPGFLEFRVEVTEADLETDDLRALFRQAEAEWELIGPPPPVGVEVRRGEERLAALELPPDVMDAELFPHFLCWLLEWAGLSEFGWNRKDVEGSFSAVDPDRRWRYVLRFHLHNRHVHEGLFERSVTVWAERKRDEGEASSG